MPPDCLILAFDTSAAHCAAALLLGDTVLSVRVEPMHKGQAERLFPLLEEVLAENNKNWSDLQAIGVCTGPGNFTGIRISVASARGLALSLGIPAVGISKLEAMAYGTTGHVTAVLDARRERVYRQSFDNAQALSAPQMSVLLDIYSQLEAEAVRMIEDEALDLPNAQPVESIVEAVAHLTAERYQQEHPRPAPLYLRAADAALPRDPPIVILP
ncbi:MAG: tRNA (adenosine(37)-N6)-threonylcarbamoyltransferase complex dimerization subunit type 1 TsaB [Amylibacter sp.]|nr:tRNA (adenosine(37)-N6)-threonylcarbamoyltransferase complex dimerization subunit type 1 TsaB [Amylibacter sp.]